MIIQPKPNRGYTILPKLHSANGNWINKMYISTWTVESSVITVKIWQPYRKSGCPILQPWSEKRKLTLW